MPYSHSALRKQLVRLARVDDLTLGELIAFRMITDGAAIQLACRLRTPEQLSELEETLAAMRSAVDGDFEEFSQADLRLHDAVARVSRNSLLEVCNEVVRGVVLSQISPAPDSRNFMMESLRHHSEVVAAIRAGDGPAAARVARQSLYDHYAGYVPEADRWQLRALIDG